MAQIMDYNAQRLIARWAPKINIAEKARGEALNFEKRAALAYALENTTNRIRAKEATNPGSVGQYKRYAVDILLATVPNLIANELFAVQPMQNRKMIAA